MGYRSEVRAAFYTTRKEEWPALKLLVDENFPKDLDEDLHLITSEGMWGYDYNATEIKWYAAYREVRDFERFIGLFDDIAGEMRELKGVTGEVYHEHINQWAYEFLRIGEDDGDVERKQGGRADIYPLLNAITRVEADYQTDKE